MGITRSRRSKHLNLRWSVYWDTTFSSPHAYADQFKGGPKRNAIMKVNFVDLLLFLKIGYERPCPSECVKPGEQTVQIMDLIAAYLDLMHAEHSADDVIEIMDALYQLDIVRTVDDQEKIHKNGPYIVDLPHGWYFILVITDDDDRLKLKEKVERTRFSIEYKENSVVYHV